LSAKFTSMNRNRRNVILQAPLGVGCVVMITPCSSFILVALLTGLVNASHGGAANAT
jgi:hypothetical protein